MTSFTNDVVSAYIEKLKQLLPDELSIKDYVTSEQGLRRVPEFPIIFVLCPNWNAEFQIEEGFADTLYPTYDLIIGSIVMEQQTSLIKPKLYAIIDEVTKALLEIEHSDFDYTLKHNGTFRARFGPIFSNQETFIADAQLQVTVNKRVAEQFE